MPKRLSLKDAEEAARVATRAELERHGYRFPPEVRKMIGVETLMGTDLFVVELRIARPRPEDSILLTSARVGPTVDDVTVEVFHDTLLAVGAWREGT